MDTNGQLDRSGRRGPPGGCALAIAVVCLAFLVFEENLAKVRDGSGIPGGVATVKARFGVAAVMTVGLGLAVASIRRDRGREAGCVAIFLTLPSIGWVAATLIGILLR